MQKVKIQNLIGAAFTVFFVQSVQAETTRMHFDVTILGLKAGELRYTLQKNGTTYAASGLLYPTGLAATMTTFRTKAINTLHHSIRKNQIRENAKKNGKSSTARAFPIFAQPNFPSHIG
jgi:hypothetical protein